MAQLLSTLGYRVVTNPDQETVLIVNTCGFIGPARQESLQVLGELATHKHSGQVLIAAGCLTQEEWGALIFRLLGISLAALRAIEAGKYGSYCFHTSSVGIVRRRRSSS